MKFDESLIPESRLSHKATIDSLEPNDRAKRIVFMHYVQANKWMRAEVVTRQRLGGEYLCAWCEEPINIAKYRNWHLHHITYNGSCSYGPSTIKRHSWFVHKPDCESCFLTNRAGFDECASKLRAVHGRCNHEIHLKGYR